MRGILSQFALDPQLPRITPVYAGNTAFGLSAIHLCGDHPRLCGEYAKRAVVGTLTKGSPPSMRGIP